jgi:hypothetical protein
VLHRDRPFQRTIIFRSGDVSLKMISILDDHVEVCGEEEVRLVFL